jgi:hypothetical protein
MTVEKLTITVPQFVLRKARELKRKNKDDPAYGVSRQFVGAWRAVYDTPLGGGNGDNL